MARGGSSAEGPSRSSLETSSVEKGRSGGSYEIKPVTESTATGSGNPYEIKPVTEKTETASASKYSIESVGVGKATETPKTAVDTEKPAETTKIPETSEETEKTGVEKPELKGKEAFLGRRPVTETPGRVTEPPKTTVETEKPAETPEASLVTESPEAGKKPGPTTAEKLYEPLVEEKTGAAGIAETRETSEDVEKKAEAALKELDLKEYTEETLRQVEHESATQTFRDGEGKEITKTEAVDTMVGDLDAVLDSLREEGREISDEQKQAILEDARRTVYAQEAESQSRGIGSHGVSHLYGVYERTRDIPDEVLEQAAANVRERAPESEATAADMRAALIVAAICHDEGYLSGQARQGPGKDGLHGVDSAIAFEYKHAPLLDGAVDSAVLEDARLAMAEHNVLPEDPDTALQKAGVTGDSPVRREVLEEVAPDKRADMDPNGNFIRSALLLSDKLAVDADEKMPDVLRDEERAQVMVSYYRQQSDRISEDERAQLMVRLEKDSITGEAAAAELSKREKALLAEKNEGRTGEMKQQLSDMVRSDPGLSEAMKERYLAAIEKDINPGAGGFDLPMAGVTTPATALRFSLSEEGGTKHIEAEATLHHRMDDSIYVENFGDKTGPGVAKPPEGKKLRGAFEDLGITEETIRTEAGGSVDALLVREDEDTSVVRTDGIDGLEHVTVKVKRIDPETVKGDVNETVAAIEAQAEAERAREAGLQIRREAEEAFRESAAKGEHSLENVLTLCGAVYEGNEAEVQQIIDRIQADPDMPPEEVEKLTARCLAMCDAQDRPPETVEQPDRVEPDSEMYKARLDRTPVNHGEWVDEKGNEGVRGESRFVPESESVQETLRQYGVDGIEYREALPDFSPVTRFDAYLEPEYIDASDALQFEMCILSLQEAVIEDPDTGAVPDPELANQFTEDQLIDISEGRTPEGYVWHHNTEIGHMQLVPLDVHQACRHLGGRSIWGGGAKARTAGRRSIT